MAGASEIRSFQVTCPAGTAQATPQITKLAMPVRTVTHIRVRIPPGPSGTMGFAIGSTGKSIMPYGDGQFFVGDGEVVDWDPVNQIDSGSWQCIMYNTGLFDHTIYILFTVQLPDPKDANSPSPLLDTTTLSSAPAPSTLTLDSTLPAAPELT